MTYCKGEVSVYYLRTRWRFSFKSIQGWRGSYLLFTAWWLDFRNTEMLVQNMQEASVLLIIDEPHANSWRPNYVLPGYNNRDRHEIRFLRRGTLTTQFRTIDSFILVCVPSISHWLHVSKEILVTVCDSSPTGVMVGRRRVVRLIIWSFRQKWWPSYIGGFASTLNHSSVV